MDFRRISGDWPKYYVNKSYAQTICAKVIKKSEVSTLPEKQKEVESPQQARKKTKKTKVVPINEGKCYYVMVILDLISASSGITIPVQLSRRESKEMYCVDIQSKLLCLHLGK